MSFELVCALIYLPKTIEMQKDSDGRLIVTAPRLNELRIKQQLFRQFTEQYVELYT